MNRIGEPSRDSHRYEEPTQDEKTLQRIAESVGQVCIKLAECMHGMRPATDIVEEVIPDLDGCKARVLWSLNLSAESVRRIEDTQLSETDALMQIAQAHGIVCSHFEITKRFPYNRCTRMSEETMTEIPTKLHLARSILARIHGVNLATD